jgi:hypothetical protein
VAHRLRATQAAAAVPTPLPVPVAGAGVAVAGPSVSLLSEIERRVSDDMRMQEQLQQISARSHEIQRRAAPPATAAAAAALLLPTAATTSTTPVLPSGAPDVPRALKRPPPTVVAAVPAPAPAPVVAVPVAAAATTTALGEKRIRSDDSRERARELMQVRSPHTPAALPPQRQLTPMVLCLCHCVCVCLCVSMCVCGSECM